MRVKPRKYEGFVRISSGGPTGFGSQASLFEIAFQGLAFAA